jgi:hypothetical protein
MLVDKLWGEKENLRPMPRFFVWTAEWIVIAFSEIKNMEATAGLRVHEKMSTTLAKFQESEGYQVMSTRQLHI